MCLLCNSHVGQEVTFYSWWKVKCVAGVFDLDDVDTKLTVLKWKS